jgi:endoglycosylceramidase
MNEPNAFNAAESASLSAMYSDALQAIRTAERAAGSPSRLILFEPSALWSLLGKGAPPAFEHDRDVVYAPHIYIGSISPGMLSAAVFQVPVDEAKGFGGAPVLVGEWGADPRSAADPTYTYFLDHQALQDQFFFGATLWTWHESCGDPHKQADYRAGRIPSVWGEFEVDCNTNTITGLRDDAIHELTRAYVRAAPGHLLASSFANETGAFTAHGTGAAAGDELLAFYPAALHGAPVLTVSGLTDLQQIPAAGNNQYIVARAAGGDWSLATQ